MRSTLRPALLGLGLWLFAACADAKGKPELPALDYVQVLPISTVLEVGQSATLGAQHVSGREAINVTSTVEWTSDDESVVTVTYDAESGAVATAVAPGVAHVIVRGSGTDETSGAEITVVAGVAALALDSSVFEIAAGTSLKLGAALLTDDGGKRAFDEGVWGSSDPTVLSVDDTGLLTGIAEGDATITLTRDGLTTSQPVRVEAWALESISVETFGGTTLPLAAESTIRVVGTFEGGREQDVTSGFTLAVEVPDPEAAEDEEAEPIITLSGATVTAGSTAGEAVVVGEGKAGSAVADESFRVDYTVSDAVLESLAIEAPAVLSTAGELGDLRILGTYGDLTVETTAPTLTAEPEGIIYIDTVNRTITPLATGTVTITAVVTLPDDDDDDPENDPTVEAEPHELEVIDDAIGGLTVELADDADTTSLPLGGALVLTAAASFGSATSDVSNQAVWTSDDETRAVVSSVRGGRVHALAAGEVTISATYKGETASITLTVTP